MKNKTRNLVITALMIAAGVILPMAFHGVPNAGKVFLPMHIPVLLCGMVTGPVFGLAAGIITPIVSSLATGMPAAAMLPQMICELGVYGLMTGLLSRKVRTGKAVADIWSQAESSTEYSIPSYSWPEITALKYGCRPPL